MTSYLISFIIFQALFLLFYELFLKKETFFKLNRWYLLLSPFAAAFIPLLEFDFVSEVIPVISYVEISSVFINGTQASVSPTASVLAFDDWLMLVYGGGVLVSLLIFLGKCMALRNLVQTGKKEKHKGIWLVTLPESRMACSFFNHILIGDQLSREEKEQIILHEYAHIQQRHSWDLILFEAWRILLWFSPFIYRQQAQISLLHEYLVDEALAQGAEKKTYFEGLLNVAFGTRHIHFTNQFLNQSLIKKRILMLQKPKSNRKLMWKYVLLLPLIMTMLVYVACTTDSLSSETPQEEMIAPPPPPVPPKQISPNEASHNKIPFAVIDHGPVFPGCEGIADPKAQKKCFSSKMNDFVMTHFDTELFKKEVSKGIKRITVTFTINTEGKIVNIKAEAKNDLAAQEAIRTVRQLPKMIPGKQNGEAIEVVYTLPIIYKVV